MILRQQSEIGAVFFKIRNRGRCAPNYKRHAYVYFTLAGRGPKVGQIPGFVRPTSQDGDLPPNLDVTLTLPTRFTA